MKQSMFAPANAIYIITSTFNFEQYRILSLRPPSYRPLAAEAEDLDYDLNTIGLLSD